MRIRIPGGIRAARLAGRARGVAGLAGVSRAGARAYGVRRATVARRARWLRSSQGFEFDEALGLGLLDPAMSPETCSRFASRHVNMAAQLRLNGHDMPPIVGEKLVFQRFCEGIGVPVPRLVAVIDRLGGSWMLPGRALPLDSLGAEGLPSSFVVKPSGGYEGFGVLLLRREKGDRLVHADGRPTTFGALVAELRAHPEFDAWIVQERLRNHPALVALGGDATLHTARIVTLVDRDGRAEILAACLRLGLSGGVVDNFHGGTLGNTLCTVDVDSGVPRELVRSRADGVGLAWGPAPAQMVAPLPEWGAACALVLAACPAFLPVRALGWDVALTPEGPVVIEANTRFGAFPVAGARDVVDRLEREGAPR